MTDDKTASAAPETERAFLTISTDGMPLRDVAVFVFNADNKDCLSAARKLGQARHGALVGLTEAEMTAIGNTDDFRRFI